MTVAAAEAAVGLAIILASSATAPTVNADELASAALVTSRSHESSPPKPRSMPSTGVLLADPAAAVARVPDRGRAAIAPLASCKITSPLVGAARRSLVALRRVADGSSGAPEGARARPGSALLLDRGRAVPRSTSRSASTRSPRVMMLIVTGVGFLIHVYSVGYMEHDAGLRALLRLPEPLHVRDAAAGPRRQRCSVLFVGWEGVGLCSYLLIGFWYDKDENAAAGKKAFIVNRVGDVGFLLGDVPARLEPDGATAASSSLDFAHIDAHARRARDRRPRRRSRCLLFWSAPPASRRRSRSTSGCPTRWPARRRSRR